MLRIHIGTVRRAIDSAKPIRVLQCTPPPVAEEEKKLLRVARSRLVQLRIGFSPLLNSYMSRIDNQMEDKGPDC